MVVSVSVFTIWDLHGLRGGQEIGLEDIIWSFELCSCVGWETGGVLSQVAKRKQICFIAVEGLHRDKVILSNFTNKGHLGISRRLLLRDSSNQLRIRLCRQTALRK